MRTLYGFQKRLARWGERQYHISIITANKMTYPLLQLKPREERRLKAGHCWIYSNEIDTIKTPLKSFTAGQLIRIAAAGGKLLGIGYINPNCLLCARLLTSDATTTINTEWFKARLQIALQWRERYFAKPYYRWVFGESDGLPGLVIDRFAETLVVQCNTAGMDHLQSLIFAALEELMKPRCILLRNDSSVRHLEQLASENKMVKGNDSLLLLEENDTLFMVDAMHGQKTGWFYDHRDNRLYLNHLARGKRILDVFCYAGAFGVQVARHGAEKVECIDSSERALAMLTENAKRNQIADRITTHQGNAFEVLQQFIEENRQFDMVILDPPAFIKRQKDKKSGQQAYKRLNRLALQLLTENGLLFSASCSFHLERDELVDLIRQAALEERRTLQIVYQGHQGADHPIHPAITQTNYLKAFLARISS